MVREMKIAMIVLNKKRVKRIPTRSHIEGVQVMIKTVSLKRVLQALEGFIFYH